MKLISSKYFRIIYRTVKDIAENSGIHGIAYVFDGRLRPSERILWVIMLGLACISAFQISIFQYHRLQESPTVMSLERDSRTWSGMIPAVTLCLKNRLDEELARDLIFRKWNTTPDDDDYYYLLGFVSAVVNATSHDYQGITEYSDDERLADVNLLEMFETIRPFAPNVISFGDDLLISVQSAMTERGMCYVINSHLNEIINNSYSNDWQPVRPKYCRYAKQECFLELLLFSNEAYASIHSPYETLDAELETVGAGSTEEVQVLYKVVETISSDSLRDLQRSQRGCVFPDENIINFPIYSKNMCRLQCRIKVAQSLCSCTPIFYPFAEGPFCTATGMSCLQDFSWPVWSFSSCNCPQTCISSEYSIKKVIRKETSSNEFDDGHLSPKSFFRLEVIPPTTRIRRRVLFSFEDFVVSFGGTVALFLGFSIWSTSQMIWTAQKHLAAGIIHILKRN